MINPGMPTLNPESRWGMSRDCNKVQYILYSTLQLDTICFQVSTTAHMLQVEVVVSVVAGPRTCHMAVIVFSTLPLFEYRSASNQAIGMSVRASATFDARHANLGTRTFLRRLRTLRQDLISSRQYPAMRFIEIILFPRSSDRFILV